MMIFNRALTQEDMTVLYTQGCNAVCALPQPHGTPCGDSDGDGIPDSDDNCPTHRIRTKLTVTAMALVTCVTPVRGSRLSASIVLKKALRTSQPRASARLSILWMVLADGTPSGEPCYRADVGSTRVAVCQCENNTRSLELGGRSVSENQFPIYFPRQISGMRRLNSWSSRGSRDMSVCSGHARTTTTEIASTSPSMTTADLASIIAIHRDASLDTGTHFAVSNPGGRLDAHCCRSRHSEVCSGARLRLLREWRLCDDSDRSQS